MTTPTPTDGHLQAIAYLVEAITAGRWHRAGIMAALRDCTDQPLWLTAHAAIVAAHTRTDQTTPAVIAMVGPHWDDPTTKPDNGKPKPPKLAPFPPPAPTRPAPPEVVAAHRERIRQALADGHVPTTDERGPRDD